MKAVFCTADFPHYVTGVNSWLKRLLPRLQALGVECHLIVATRGEANLNFVDFLIQGNYRCDILPYERFKYAEERTKEIIRILIQSPPDVIVPGFIAAGFYAAKWLKKVGTSTIAILHSDDSLYRAIAQQFLMNDHAWQADACVTVSQYLYSYVQPLVRSDLPLVKIPCGVNITPYQASAPSDNLKIVYVGRLEEEQKRISEVTRAFCRVVNEVEGVEATIYGSGSKRDKVIDIIRQEGKGKAVQYGGVLNSEEVQIKLQTYHVFVLLSDYEGLPVSLLEAMSCGLVPVCLEIRSGIHELIQNNINGIIVKDRGDDFVKAIRTLRQDLSGWQSFSLQARATVVRGFSIDETALQWKQLIEKLPNRYTSVKNRQIKLPSAILLPEQHPDLTWENVHRPTLRKRVRKMVGGIFIKMKRMLNNH